MFWSLKTQTVFQIHFDKQFRKSALIWSDWSQIKGPGIRVHFMQIRQLLQAFQWVDSCGKTSRSEFKHENLRRLHWKLTTFSCHEKLAKIVLKINNLFMPWKLAKVVLRHTQTPLLDLFLLSHFWEPLYSPRNYLKVASVTTTSQKSNFVAFSDLVVSPSFVWLFSNVCLQISQL